MSVGVGPVRFGGFGALLGWAILRAVGVVVRLAVCRPRVTSAAVGAVAVGWLLVAHPVVVLLPVTVAAHAVDVWALTAPSSWRRRGRPVVYGWARRLFVYRRQWQPAVLVTGLDRGGVLPRLGRVRALERVDVVQVRGLLGQRFADWEEAGPMLAHVFGARDVRVHRGDDRRLTLEFVRGRRGTSWNRGGRLDLEAAA